MDTKTAYPSLEHDQAARAVVDFFSGKPVDAVILTCSCARGKASRDSCLDISVLLSPEDFTTRRDALERHWDQFYESEEVFQRLHRVGKYSHVDLDFTDGHFQPQDWGWTGGPDNFELEIGNILVYSVPLLEIAHFVSHEIALKARQLEYLFYKHVME